MINQEKREAMARNFLKNQDMSKTAFFDALGDDVLFEFIQKIQNGDRNAIIFDYRLKNARTVSLQNEKTKQGLEWMADNFSAIDRAALEEMGWL